MRSKNKKDITTLVLSGVWIIGMYKIGKIIADEIITKKINSDEYLAKTMENDKFRIVEKQ